MFYFLTLYLQGASEYTPMQAGLAFLPQTIGVALMVIAMARLSRLSSDTNYLTGIALAMLLYGAAQGLVLSSLTTAGMAGVAPEDAGVAGGLVNVAHHLAARSASASKHRVRYGHRSWRGSARAPGPLRRDGLHWRRHPDAVCPCRHRTRRPRLASRYAAAAPAAQSKRRYGNAMVR